MAPSEHAWDAVTKFKIRGCKHCPGRNSASDVKANSKRQLAPPYRQGRRYPQLLRGGVLGSGFSSRHVEVVHTEREKGNRVPFKTVVEDLQGKSESRQQALVATATQSASRPDPTQYVGTPAIGTSRAVAAAGISSLGPANTVIDRHRRRFVWSCVAGFLRPHEREALQRDVDRLRRRVRTASATPGTARSRSSSVSDFQRSANGFGSSLATSRSATSIVPARRAPSCGAFAVAPAGRRAPCARRRASRATSPRCDGLGERRQREVRERAGCPRTRSAGR